MVLLGESWLSRTSSRKGVGCLLCYPPAADLGWLGKELCFMSPIHPVSNLNKFFFLFRTDLKMSKPSPATGPGQKWTPACKTLTVLQSARGMTDPESKGKDMLIQRTCIREGVSLVRSVNATNVSQTESVFCILFQHISFPLSHQPDFTQCLLCWNMFLKHYL